MVSLTYILIEWDSSEGGCIRALQRDRTNRRLISINEIYCKELAQVIMVAEMSHDLPFPSWGTRNASVWFECLRARGLVVWIPVWCKA